MPGTLGDFLRQHREEVLPRWLASARKLAPGAGLPQPALLDHLPVILARTADAADRIAQGDWSHPPAEDAVDQAMARLAEGFELRQVLTELFLLRQVLLELVLGTRWPSDPVSEAQLLSWAVDSVVRGSVAAFTAAKQKTLQALDGISREALSSRAMDEVLLRLLETIIGFASRVDVACLFLAEGDRLQHRATAGHGGPAHARVTVAVGQGLVGRVAAERKPLAASSERDDSPEGAALRQRGIRGLYAVPLVAEGELLGVVQMGSATLDRLPEEDAALLSALGERLGAAVHETQLRARAEVLARERDQLLRQREIAFDATGMGWWSYTPATRTASFDRRFTEIFGIQGTHAPIEGILKFIHPDDLAGVRAAMEAALNPAEPKLYSARYRINRPDGEVRWIEAHGTAIVEGEGPDRRVASLVGGLTDITERKRAEDELREADRRKNEFLGMLSHELRNPLAPIRSSLYILGRAAPGSEQARRAQQVIDRQVSHLARLVDDLLDVTRISRGKTRLEMARLDLVGLVRKAIDDQRSLLASRGLRVDLPSSPVWVDGDPTRLSQIVGNLLQNAAKFTTAGASITVSLMHTAGQAQLEISDTGSGIDRGTLKRLFEPFAQAERTLARSQGGLGLGLALVKGLVELHGGEVVAESEGPGRGARFRVRLPSVSPSRQPPPPAPSEPGHRQRTVLVVEDNKDSAESLSEALTLAGHRVLLAYDGESALPIAQQCHPDIVLCDVGLPGMDGYAVASAIKKNPATASSYVIALTGYAQPEDQHRAHQAGFDAHIPKPPDILALDGMVSGAPDRV